MATKPRKHEEDIWFSLSCLRVVVVAFLSSGALAALATQAPVLSKDDRDISRTMLRQIREDLERYYYDPTFHGIDLKARFAEAETRIDKAANVQRAIRKARGYKTLILDLRGNGGGALTALSALVSTTFDHEVLVAVDRPRGKERPEVAKPAKNAFLGKLFVLVDSRSASASEMFARILQLEKRGAVVGDRTTGAVMAAQFFPHTVGLGAVAFYAMEVTVADVRMSDGAGLEKIGVQPDVLALPSPADLAARRDPVLARAVELAGGSMTPEQAGQLFAAR
jgi:C-terminal processing protease CtpA/Prc